jgi:small ligand-binding sensory domain FIST
MKVATSIILGKTASADLAAQAVTNAMQKADISIASSVLLLLTSEFASNPQDAIKAAAKAANCMQVMGCSATGIFTEEDWVLDAPAAAAMVFGDGVSLELPQNNFCNQPLLTLSAPNAINSTWLNNSNRRYGGVSGDAIGQGPFSVWQNAKGEVSGYVEAFFSGVNIATGTSHGVQLLTQPQQIQLTDQFDLKLLNHQVPLNGLQKAWKAHSKSDETVPLHLIVALYADSAEAITQGHFNQTTIISYDEDNGSITLAQPLQAGQFLSWSLRATSAAEADITILASHLTEKLGCPPDFALLFSCLGRGPYFYNGIDRDLKVITKNFPNMPVLGFYGNGEIAYLNGDNRLLPYSAVLSLFSSAKTT